MSRYLKVSEEVYKKLRGRDDVVDMIEEYAVNELIINMLMDANLNYYIKDSLLKESALKENKEKIKKLYEQNIIEESYKNLDIQSYASEINEMDLDMLNEIEQNSYNVISTNIEIFDIRKQLENMNVNIHHIDPFKHENQIKDIEASMSGKISENLFKENSIEIFAKGENSFVVLIKIDDEKIAIGGYDGLLDKFSSEQDILCIVTEKLIEKENICISDYIYDNEHHNTIRDYIAILIILEKYTNFL